MNPCQRGPTPPLLARYGQDVGKAYAQRRATDPAYHFRWPQRDGQSLYDEAAAAAELMTLGRCAYCDGYPLNATGRKELDHFRPKGRPEFYRLVCAWDNLFMACTACNGAKQEKWDEALLRPDDPDFRFERYFEYRFATGEILPNPVASRDDQHKANVTMTILDLNRTDACLARRQVVKLLLGPLDATDLADLGYRYLIPLCQAA